jgi:hypothetical protein
MSFKPWTLVKMDYMFINQNGQGSQLGQLIKPLIIVMHFVNFLMN